ncbi:hypothetical protein A6M21_01425 [Desulfotomaculum copahuensis]|uniref:Uncharacterized protein n=1 Tax=Desulfotomaculum copahuensis TaxID=1838280 RepID=A0A1B7LAR4_9FIRM|nr:hypothetical protein A6M21_01425 [Desulfotomaculum copahuensis]
MKQRYTGRIKVRGRRIITRSASEAADGIRTALSCATPGHAQPRRAVKHRPTGRIKVLAAGRLRTPIK